MEIEQGYHEYYDNPWNFYQSSFNTYNIYFHAI